jgi:MFS-type transporter involved in bile tolerance (Atg22 family)
VTALAPSTWWHGLGGLTRSGSAVEGFSWAVYDFANTIYSFAIVSFAMGPWAVRFLGKSNGTFLFTLAGSASVALILLLMIIGLVIMLGVPESNDDDDQPGLPVTVFPPELVAPLETVA